MTRTTRHLARWVSLLVALLPATAVAAESTPTPGCPASASLPVVDDHAMAWAPAGLEPDNLAKLDATKIGAWAAKWLGAWDAAGVDFGVLTGLANAVSAWGAVQKTKSATLGRYDYFVLDTLVAALNGRAILVLSAKNAWDHTTGILPSDRTAFRDYVTAMVKRYDGDADFGIPDGTDPSYPDVDGTGKTTIADSESPKEVKLAWAQTHRVAGYMIETDGAPAGTTTDYASVAKDALTAALAASKGVEVWLAPVPVTMAKSDWQARFGSMTLPAGAAGHVAAVVSVPGLGADLAGAAGLDRFAQLAKWYADAGLDGLRLVIGNVSLGTAKGKAGCPDDRCSAQMQAEQAAKVIAGAAALGAHALGYAGAVEPMDAPTGAGLVAMDGSTGEVATEPASQVFKMLKLALARDGNSRELPTGAPVIPSTREVRGQSCADETDIVVWYDWTREVGPGQDYGDLIKAVVVDVPFESVKALAMAAPDPVGASTQPFPAATFTKADGGGTSVMLGRTPVLVMSRPGGWVPVTPEVADEGETGETVVETAESSSDGGCTTGGPAGVAWFLILLPALRLALRPRKAT